MADPGRAFDDWIEAYLAYTLPTEPPEIYHRWTAISTIASALRRRSHIGFSHFNLYPNHYIVLTGPPGAMKSSASRIGRELLSHVPGLKFTVDSTTREKLILDLSQSYADGQSAMTAYCSEFASFFASSGPDMAVFLTDIYECPVKWSHASKSGGTQDIKTPCLNVIACTTAESMQKALPLQAIGLGTTSRIIFVCAKLPRERDWRTRKTETQIELEKYLISDLHQIASIAGEFNFTPEADKVYNDWNKAYKQDPYGETTDDRLRPYFARKHTHILKLCMVLSAGRRNSGIMTLDDLSDAHAILTDVESHMGEAFAGVGASPLAGPYEFVIDLLAHSQVPIPHMVIVDRLKRDVKRAEVDEILETLTLSNAVRKMPIDGSPGQFAYLLRD